MKIDTLPVGWRQGEGEEKILSLPLSTALKHALITGATGWGKSGFLLSVILWLLTKHPEVGIVLVDLKGETAAELRDHFVPTLVGQGLALRPESIVSIQPFGRFGVPLNPLIPLKGLGVEVQAHIVTLLVGTLVEGGLEPRMTSILSSVLRSLIGIRGTLLDCVRLLTDEGYRALVASRVRSEEDRRYLLETLPREPVMSLEALRSRLEWLLLLPELRAMLCADGCLRGSDLLEAPLGVVDLGGAPQGFKALGRFVGSLLFQLVASSVFARGGNQRPVLLIVDEWQELAGTLQDDFERLLAQARFKGVGLWLANQTLAQVSEVSGALKASLMTNIALHVAFRPDPSDVRHASHLLPISGQCIDPEHPDRLLTREAEEKALLSRLSHLPPRHALLANHVAGRADVIRTLSLPYVEARQRAVALPAETREKFVRGKFGIPMDELIAGSCRGTAGGPEDAHPVGTPGPQAGRSAPPGGHSAGGKGGGKRRPPLVLP